jgi:predicted O-methyltransferase YrrM
VAVSPDDAYSVAVAPQDYDNLDVLYSAFSKDAIDNIFSNECYRYEDVEFVSKYAPGSTPERFHIVKSLPFIEYFVEFSRAFEGRSIFELGIAEGGSTALLALVAKPHKLIAVDLEPNRIVALDLFAEQRGLGDTMKMFYSVDQSDAGALRRIAAEEFGDAGIDWVLDDASHQLAPTRASFDALFPYLNPGGVFTIEDWNADIAFRDALFNNLQNPETPEALAAAAEFREAMAANKGKPTAPPKASLSQLAVELMLACASSNHIVSEVAVNEHWIMARRGPAEVDPEGFHLADLSRDYFGFVPATA